MDSEQVKKQLQDFSDLTVLAESATGLKLIEDTKTVIKTIVGQLAYSYKDKSHIELVCLCASLQANLSVFELLTGIDEQVKQIEALYEKKE